jgi:23S rRNA (guanosine2251-2'-O)-methyltransferase
VARIADIDRATSPSRLQPDLRRRIMHRSMRRRNLPPRAAQPSPPPHAHQPHQGVWLYGAHAVRAALANPRRRVHSVLVAGDAQLPEVAQAGGVTAHVERSRIEAVLPPGAVHQNLAALVSPLPAPALAEIGAALAEQQQAVVIALDRVSDPQNAGAVLRVAAAFGALAVIVPEHGAPPETGALAKAASGALERVPIVRVANLARAIDTLKQAGAWSVGLASDATRALSEIDLSGRIVLALGSEGSGLRRLTGERCDFLARLPTAPDFAELNVAAAAAIALYETVRQRPPAPSHSAG